MQDLLPLLIGFGIIIGSLVLHELGHAVVAYWLGDETAKTEGRLSLNPLAHLDPTLSLLLPLMLLFFKLPLIGGAKPVPVDHRRLKFREYGMALVALAGPVVNLILATVAFGVLVGMQKAGLSGNELIVQIAVSSVQINLGLMAFNLLPIPPLDGSRVLYVILPDQLREWMTRIEGSLGLTLIFLLVMLDRGVIAGVIGAISSTVLRGLSWIFRV